VNSGTSALHLALLALGVTAGDEVIVPANTFIATAWAVSYTQATPVFVDCESDTWNISAEKIEEKITKRTKAIIGVHLYGQPFDIEAIKDVASKYDLFLIEDCAQAHGARYKGIHVGGFGEIGCFSFYPGKNLGAYGEGGAIVTNCGAYDEKIRMLRNHGSTSKHKHDCIGFNMRMDGFQGAVLDVKLKYLETWNQKRKDIALMYRKGLTHPGIVCQVQPSWADSVYHLFVVAVEKREAMMKHLQSYGISPGIHYPIPCHMQKAYADLGYKAGDLPNAERLAASCLSLPMYPELSDEEVLRVIDLINRFSVDAS
jgi:dTDP-4-amino-4,6-dideoxygalactose transaminase